MSQPVADQPPTFESLLAHNAALLERHKRSRVFQMFGDGTLDDPDKRETFLACLHGFARHFQTILFTRQAHCADDRYGSVFLRHLQEEIGHDDILQKDRARSDQIWDPILEATTAWFVSRMTVLDNIEKLAIVHLVLESSGAHMGAVSRAPMRQLGSANYFGLHDEIDDSHVAVALGPIRRQPPDILARLMTVIEQAWQMLDTHAARMAELVLGAERATLWASGTR